MITDIPNYISFPFEIGIALMILWLDKQAKNRATVRTKEREGNETKQRDRFNNFLKESSKHQVFLLESILESLDPIKAEQFSNSIQSKYRVEIQQDVDDLENLITQQAEDEDRDLSGEIEQKVDELEASSVISNLFASENLDESLQTITESTKHFVQDFTSKAYTGGRVALKNNINKLIKNIKMEKDIMSKEFEKLTQLSSDEKEKGGVTAIIKNALKEIDLSDLSKLKKKSKEKEES